METSVFSHSGPYPLGPLMYPISLWKMSCLVKLEPTHLVRLFSLSLFPSTL